jgi:hypothetical protein
MAKNDKFVDTPVDMIGNPPKGNKGGPGVYNGEDQGPFSGYKRTPSPDAVPEKLYDGSIPTTGKGEVSPNKLPKNL